MELVESSDNPMETRSDDRRASGGFTISVIACFLIAVAGRLCFLTDPFRNDAGIYIYFGKVVWTGGRLYTDFWDTKLPSIGLLTAPLYAAFGNHWWAYVVFQAVLGIGGALVLALAARRYVADWTFAPALLFGLLGINLSRLVITGFQLETIQLFFEILAAVMVLRSLKRDDWSQILLAGILVGLATMPKPSGLAVGGAAVCAYLWEAKSRGIIRALSRIAILGFGTALPVLIVIAWVRHQPWQTEMPELFKQIKLYGTGTPWRRLSQLRAWVFLLLPFSPLIIRWVWVKVCPADGKPDRPAGPVLVFALAWCAAEVSAVILQKRLYSYHFLVIMPAAVLLFAVARRTRLIPMLVAIAPIAITSIWGSIDVIHLNAGRPQPLPVSTYVAEHTVPGDYVWGDPEARLLLETGRLPGSRLQMTFYLVNHDQAPAEFTKILLGDFDQRKPKYIVLPQKWHDEVRAIANNTVWMAWLPQRRAAYLKACDEIEDYIRHHYIKERNVDGQEAWRRVGT
jgi:hypothetical protein